MLCLSKNAYLAISVRIFLQLVTSSHANFYITFKLSDITMKSVSRRLRRTSVSSGGRPRLFRPPSFLPLHAAFHTCHSSALRETNTFPSRHLWNGAFDIRVTLSNPLIFSRLRLQVEYVHEKRTSFFEPLHRTWLVITNMSSTLKYRIRCLI